MCDSSATTHLRVVFNASCLSSNGISLNDLLMVGPSLQPDLIAVTIRWRCFKYVYIADIAKMYRQILIDPRDVDCQRILWRPEIDDPVREYQLLTVTYGTAYAPYLTLRVLQQFAQHKGHRFPLATGILQKHIYVDDYIFGTDEISSALRIRDQLIDLLNSIGFPLRKWAINNSDLLTGIRAVDHGLAQTRHIRGNDQLKVLGLT